jgi:ligand-binding sensor domain-containing protein
LWVGTSEGLAWLMPKMPKAKTHVAFSREVK